jgi:hypothetical protein
MFGSSGASTMAGNTMQNFVELMTVKAARDLRVDMTPAPTKR